MLTATQAAEPLSPCHPLTFLLKKKNPHQNNQNRFDYIIKSSLIKCISLLMCTQIYTDVSRPYLICWLRSAGAGPGIPVSWWEQRATVCANAPGLVPVQQTSHLITSAPIHCDVTRRKENVKLNLYLYLITVHLICFLVCSRGPDFHTAYWHCQHDLWYERHRARVLHWTHIHLDSPRLTL